jgi:putative membrane protein
MTAHPFSQSDLDRIAEAVRAAESKTSGEIVPYFVSQSDDYSVARWRGGTTFSASVILVCLAIQFRAETWIGLRLLEFSALILISFLIGMLMVRASATFKRLMLGHALMDHRVSQRASAAFLSEEVFKTRERTGILLFVSFFEQRVVVLGDSGINAKVVQSEWDDIVYNLVKNVKAGKTVDGLVSAIQECGELLQKHGVERQRDDTDELGDSLRVG